MKYVIIGNSAAAVGAIEGIRSIDENGSITVISNEQKEAYGRPLISYLLQGKTDEQRMLYRNADFYEKNGVEVIKSEAVSVDSSAKTVGLIDGNKIKYDRLLLAIGSLPIDLKMKDSHTFMTLSDAQALRDAVTDKSNVLILGAGLIGLKCAEGLHGLAGHITVVDMASRILPNVLDDYAAKMVQSHLESKGIEIILGEGAKSAENGKAVLSSGREIEYDILVCAVGVKPNTALAVSAGCKVNRGIETDLNCNTSVEDIYAAGDCAETLDTTSDAKRVLALWPNAYISGECAGINMAGGDKKCDKLIPMNAGGFLGLHIITAGNYDGEEYVNISPNGYKKLVVKDGLLKGYILVGDVERAGIYTALIRDKTPLDTIDFELIKEKPQLMAFSKTERAIKLGGAR